MAKKPDLQLFRKALEDALAEVTGPAAMEKLAKMGADMIRTRTRLGDGVDAPGGTRAKLKPLAPKTVENRTRAKKKGALSELTTPRRSNLTETGQLLNSLTVKKSAKGSATVGPKGSRKDGLSNEKVGEYVTDGGRPFNNLSKIEIKRLTDQMRRDLMSALKRRKLTR